MRLLLACWLVSLALSSTSTAQEDEWGFDDEETYVSEASADATESERVWELSGDLSLGASYNYLDHHSATGTPYGNLSRLRAQLDLQLDVDLRLDWKLRVEGYGFYDFTYIFKGLGQYTHAVRDDYIWEVDFREVWLQGRLGPSLDWKLGRQIVNWGRSDTLRVLDVLNPLDNREPGLVDIDDLRLPLTMARIDYYPKWIPEGWGAWNLQLLVIPEFRQARNPPVGSDFNPSPIAIDLPSDKPDHFFDDPEYGGSLTGMFSGWDVSLYAARIYANTPVVVFAEGLPPGFLRHDQITMVGAGGNWTVGSWLFKGEIGWFDGLAYTSGSSPSPGVVSLQTGEKCRIDSLVGVEYYGINDLQIAFELVQRHILDYDSGLKFEIEGVEIADAEEDAFEAALRVTADFMNSRLQLTGVGFVLFDRAYQGSVIRLQANYQLVDALNLSGGIVLYKGGDDAYFDSIDRNDRLFLQVDYSF